jgi:uncharacterized iron-regulated membrane protein
MPILSQFLNQPRQQLLRKALFQVHLWSGLFVAVYILIISVSGAALVFRDEMERELDPRLYRVADRSPELLAPAQIRAALKRIYPAHRVSTISFPDEHRDTLRVSMVLLASKGTITDFQAVLHPNTGAVVGELRPTGTVLRFLRDLHFNLLAGRTGRIANGIGGFFLTVLCATGLVIWWPGIKSWARALKVDFRRSWKRVNYDLHSAVGFWLLALISWWGITGVYFAWPDEFRMALSRITTVTFDKLPQSQLTSNPMPELPDRFLAAAHTLIPGARVSSFTFPKDATDTYRLTVFPPQSGQPRGDILYFDQYSGVLLKHWRKGFDQPLGDLLLTWIGPLHFGDFGGAPVKSLWLIFGLAPGLLAVTGVCMWWNRAGVKFWRKRDRKEVSVASAAPARELVEEVTR